MTESNAPELPQLPYGEIHRYVEWCATSAVEYLIEAAEDGRISDDDDAHDQVREYFTDDCDVIYTYRATTIALVSDDYHVEVEEGPGSPEELAYLTLVAATEQSDEFADFLGDLDVGKFETEEVEA